MVRPGTVCEGDGYCTLIPPSAGVRTMVGWESGGMVLWSCLLWVGFGVASAEGLVLGEEELSTLGPGSDIRGNIRDLLRESPDRKEVVKGT